MPDTDAQSAVHRRIWRLAFLLTGDSAGSVTLIDRIQRLRRDPLSLEPSLLDRLIIQNARSLPRNHILNLPAGGATPGTTEAAKAALAAVLKLPHQPREAWILRRIDDVDELHAARAMDCSKTAARTHLAMAEESMAAKLGERLIPAIASLKIYADSLDPIPLIAAHREQVRRDRRRRAKLYTIIGGVVFLLVLFAYLKFATW